MTNPINFTETERSPSDGRRVWPTDRQHMADANLITKRMAEDAAALVRERGVDAVITVDDFLEQGWTFDHVRRFGDSAISLLQADVGSHANAA